MDTVDQLSQGVTYQAIEWGYSKELVIDGFNYLVRARFLSTIDVTKLENELETARITSRGRKLIDAESNKLAATHSKHANVKLNLGVVSSEIGGEVSHG